MAAAMTCTRPHWWHNPAPAAQIAAGCADGHDPALATGVCVRCGFDVMGFYAGWCDDDLDNAPAGATLTP